MSPNLPTHTEERVALSLSAKELARLLHLTNSALPQIEKDDAADDALHAKFEAMLEYFTHDADPLPGVPDIEPGSQE